MEIVRGLDASSTSSLIPSLLHAIAALHPGNLDGDDVTVLLFSPTGPGAAPPLRDKLLAPVRVARGVLSSLRPGGGPAPLLEFTLRNIGGSMFDFFNGNRRAPREDDKV